MRSTSAVAIGKAAMPRIDRSGVRLAILAVIVNGVIDPTSACTIVTSHCNGKDACPAAPQSAAARAMPSMPATKP